ncbi:hypothetical protein [Marinobacterium sediminicola]|uniref:Uncharacterized protein n=1 Tax=Marinobacterium sediminicola TaxID=518898 RepID=A0ABY1S373_9GAMM|nr:hypothetical protein [Marinobacterium sediminicola]ULG69299.1 hypothetical protein LN244_00355 [Marinobacterium sediminicola]SMR77650.1 hypothetical protein SAMN04487964_11568 [Marinobacterium sediminicola]
MKISTLGITFALLASTHSYAGCVGVEVMGQCQGTEVRGYSNSNDDTRYESNSGSSYQYDLNKPTDRNRYTLDLDAQRRDQMSTDPRRATDRNSGQYGGGIYND